ncbi:MAG: stringent starvation protein A, partial [Gammaproteobacteria bacterium]
MASVANRRSVMVLYSDTISPVGHCVRIVLAEKEINVDINFVTDVELPEELSDLNPYNSVLTLIDRELILY